MKRFFKFLRPSEMDSPLFTKVKSYSNGILIGEMIAFVELNKYVFNSEGMLSNSKYVPTQYDNLDEFIEFNKFCGLQVEEISELDYQREYECHLALNN